MNNITHFYIDELPDNATHNDNVNYQKKYRQALSKCLKEEKEKEKEEKTPENIYKMAKESGIKPTARYFGISPSQVRYYIKKIEEKSKD